MLQPPRAIPIPPQPKLQPRRHLAPPPEVIAAWAAWSKSAKALAPQQLPSATAPRGTESDASGASRDHLTGAGAAAGAPRDHFTAAGAALPGENIVWRAAAVADCDGPRVTEPDAGGAARDHFTGAGAAACAYDRATHRYPAGRYRPLREQARYSAAPNYSGSKSLPRTERLIARPFWSCTTAWRRPIVAGSRRAPWGRSIVRSTRRSISTPRSATSAAGLASSCRLM